MKVVPVVGGAVEHVKVNAAVAGEFIRRRLELRLPGKEEDERTRLSGIAGLDIKVEDGGDRGRDGAVVRCAKGSVWL